MDTVSIATMYMRALRMLLGVVTFLSAFFSFVGDFRMPDGRLISLVRTTLWIAVLSFALFPLSPGYGENLSICEGETEFWTSALSGLFVSLGADSARGSPA